MSAVGRAAWERGGEGALISSPSAVAHTARSHIWLQCPHTRGWIQGFSVQGEPTKKVGPGRGPWDSRQFTRGLQDMEQDRDPSTNSRIQMGFLKDGRLGRVPQAEAGKAATWPTLSAGFAPWVPAHCLSTGKQGIVSRLHFLFVFLEGK